MNRSAASALRWAYHAYALSASAAAASRISSRSGIVLPLQDARSHFRPRMGGPAPRFHVVDAALDLVAPSLISALVEGLVETADQSCGKVASLGFTQLQGSNKYLLDV
jgi:hypothetical protein